MSIRGDIAAGIYGAWRLARGDAGGLGYIGATRDAFWRSFWAMAVIAPLFATLLLLRFYTEDFGTVAPTRFVLAQSIGYVIAWVLYPLIMVYVSRALDRENRYFGYIAAYNWSAVIQNSLYIPLAILAQLGAMSMDLASFLSFVVLTLVFVYTSFVARVGLGIGLGFAIAIAMGDFILAMMLNSVIDGLMRAG